MILSIGMIVKNEEKYLEQCLTALKPILDNVDSELIIADTGSTDNTFEIAKKFTDNVFHFEWINDFAAARNSTLDRAKGEWYMYIDADEIIKDCSDLINFFNSGEYKNYGSANYIQRNYNDLQKMDLYSDFRPPRLTALVNGVRFAKPIHENFNTIFTPIKYLNLVADHYGYVYKDGSTVLDIMEQKTSRNLELLFQELEEEKASGTIKETVYGQIADCYVWKNDTESVLKYIELGLENCDPESYTRLDYINKKLKAFGKQGRYNDIIELCKFYFSKDNLPRKTKLVTDCGVYFFWSVASFNLNDYNETINKAVLGFDIYRSYLNGRLPTPELNYCSIETTIPMMKQVCNMFVVACNEMKKYDIAAREIELIPLKDFMPDTVFMKSHLAIRLELMEYTNYNKIPDLYYLLDKPNRELFINVLIRNIFRTERHEHFLKKLSLIAKEDERLSDILKIYNASFITHDLTTAQMTEFVKKYGTNDNETVLVLMMQKNCDIAPYLSAEDFDPKKCASDVFGDFIYLNHAAEIFEKYTVSKISGNCVGKAAELFYQAVIAAAEEEVNTAGMILNLGAVSKRWTELYPDEQQPENIAFALMIGEIAELHRRKNYDESAARLTEIIGDDTDSSSDNENTKILRHYLTIIQKDKEKITELQEKQSENPMMAELADQIKADIREMIDRWDLNGAEEALNEMAVMVPFDPDIEDLRDEINDRKINYMNYM